MKVSLKKAFSILDGRLSTEMTDIYDMLNYVFDQQFFTHQLPGAYDKLKKANPDWFQNGIDILNNIKKENDTNDFKELMKIIEENHSDCEIELGKLEF